MSVIGPAYDDMFSNFDTILACDRRMDRQTSCNSTDCAMHSITFAQYKLVTQLCTFIAQFPSIS